ncbi:MAG: hypothetical protein ACK58L_00915 [Planctomycetota bacterium]
MATVSNQSRKTYADADEFIQYQINEARSRIKSTDLLTATALTGLLMITYVLVFTIFDHWVVEGGFNSWTRAGMLVIVLSICGTIAYRYILRPWCRHIHPLYAARVLDKTSEGLEGSLLTLVDLQAGGRKSDESIQRTLEKRAAVRLADLQVDEAIDRRLLIRLTAALFVVTAMTCLYAVFSPKSISLLRPLSVADTTVATRTVIDDVKPGTGRVPGGSHLDIIADISGVIPESIQVLYSTEDRRFVDEPLLMRTTDDPHRFHATMIGEGDRGLRQNFTYRVVAGDATSESFSIVVEQPPTAQVVEVHYEYPDYMGLPDRTDASGTIEAWEGSNVSILAESSQPIQTALLQLSDDAAFKAKGEEVRMEIRDRSLEARLELKAREDGTFPKFYRIQVFDAEGHSDPEPVVYALEIRRDQAPVVKLHDPSRDLQVPANAIIPLLVEAEDPDFVLRSVTLHYAVNGRQIQPAEILLDTTRSVMPKRWMNTHEFRLEPLNLKPGDVVTYHVQARDNRPPLGNQGRTADLNLQILGAVSEAEAQEQLRLDREIQEQQRRNLEGTPTNPAQPAGETMERDLPEGSDAQPMPNADGSPQDDASVHPPNDQSGDESQTSPGNDGQQSGTPDAQAPNATESTAKPNQAGETQPGNESAARQPKRKLDEDEALQKLIDDMNRRREQDGDSDRSDTSSGTQSKAADTTATKSKPNQVSDETEKSSSDSEDDRKSENSESDASGSDGNNSQRSDSDIQNQKDVRAPDDATGGKTENESNASERNADNPGRPEPDAEKQTSSDPSDPSEDPVRTPGEQFAEKQTEAGTPTPDADSPQPKGQQGSTPPKSATPSEMNENPDDNQHQDNSDAQGTSQQTSQSGSKDQGKSETKDGASDSRTEPEMDSPQKEDAQADNPAREQQTHGSNVDDKQGKPKEKPSDQKNAESPQPDEKQKSAAGSDQKTGDQKSAGKQETDKQDQTGGKSGQQSDDQMKGERSTRSSEQPSSSKEKQPSNSDGGNSKGEPDQTSSRSNDPSNKQNEGKSGKNRSGNPDAAGTDRKSDSKDAPSEKSGARPSKNGASRSNSEGGSKSKDTQPEDSGSSGSKSNSKSSDADSPDSKNEDSGSKSGDSNSGNADSGKQKSGDAGSAAKKPAGNPPGKSGEKASDSTSGDADSSNSPSDSGNTKNGQSGDSKSQESMNGEQESSEPYNSKSGKSESGDSKSGGEKSGGEKSGSSQSGGNKSGGKAGKGNSSSSSKGGQNSSGSGKSGPSQSTGQSTSGPAEIGGGGHTARGDQQSEDIAASDDDAPGMAGDITPVEADPAVDEAAEAASLALKRLEKDLDRGTVDQKLLEELGWTAEELTAFKKRLQKQLEERKLNEQQEKERSLSQKSFEEMLKSLDVKSAGKTREGRTDRDRDQQDTTNRQQVVPKRYQQWYEMYQRSISEGTKPTHSSNR